MERSPLVERESDDDFVPISAFTRVAPVRQSRDKVYGVVLLALVAFVVTSGSFAWQKRYERMTLGTFFMPSFIIVFFDALDFFFFFPDLLFFSS
jgi:hypothetical protein